MIITLALCALSGMAGLMLGVYVTIMASWRVYGGKPHEVRPDMYGPKEVYK